MLSLDDGARLVVLAREAIEKQYSFFGFKPDRKEQMRFGYPCACFVTLYVDGKIRGTSGDIEHSPPLYDNLIQNALQAGKDPRYSVQKEDIPRMTVEVSLVSKPKRIDVRNPGDYAKQMHPGKEGILIKSTYSKGMIMPQEAVKNRWNSLMILQQACHRAGLKQDDWQNFDLVRVYKFASQTFAEASPKGEIIQIL